MNPDKQKLLDESTKVAQTAAQTIGGTFQQGYYSPTGQIQGGFTPNLPTTISSETLAGSPAPMKLTTPQPLVGADGLLGTVETGATAFATNQQQIAQQNQKLAEWKAQVETSGRTVMQRLGLAKGEVALTEQEYAPTVDPLEKELKTINQEILEEQNALRKQLEGIQKVGILTDVQKEAQSRAIKRESASLQADLYIKQLGIQGQYDSARAIADRKIAVQLEQQKQELEILKFDYEENKELYTKAEQRQFDTMWSDRERALNAQETKMKTFENTRIALLQSANEQNAPIAIKTAIANARTTEEAISAAGIYSGDVLARQKRALEIAELQKKLAEGETTNFIDIMQDEINNGATAEAAARVAVAVSEASGVPVDQKTLTEWTTQAKKLKPIVPEALPEAPLSKIEQEITGMGTQLNASDKRYLLRQKGYSQSEIAASSVGGIVEKGISAVSTVGSFFNNLFGG